MGCGNINNAYIFFLMFHLTFSLIIFNVFVASIITAYTDEAKAQKNAVSRYYIIIYNILIKTLDINYLMLKQNGKFMILMD